MLVFYGIRWHLCKSEKGMTTCSRTYNFGQGMLAMHALSATARILTMAHHVRAQYSQARAITFMTYLNDLSNQSTNHHHARPYFHSHNSKNAINNAPRKLPISQQSKRCWHWYMIYNCIYFQYNNAGLLQPFEDLSHQIHGRIQEPGPRPSSNTLVSNHLAIINHHHLSLISNSGSTAPYGGPWLALFSDPWRS